MHERRNDGQSAIVNPRLVPVSYRHVPIFVQRVAYFIRCRREIRCSGHWEGGVSLPYNKLLPDMSYME